MCDGRDDRMNSNNRSIGFDDVDVSATGMRNYDKVIFETVTFEVLIAGVRNEISIKLFFPRL